MTKRGKYEHKHTSGRPFWDDQLRKKDTMIRAQAEKIAKLEAEIKLLRMQIAVSPR